MAVNDFAVIGLNDMGRSIALNMISRQYSVAVYDENIEAASKFAGDRVARLRVYKDMKSLVASLSVPRKIFLNVPADSIDDMVEQISPHLNKSDTFIDISDSDYSLIKPRAEALKLKSLRYLDVAVTGPREELSDGAGIIVGGSEDAFSASSRILRQISKEDKGFSCCIHSGDWGTGHYTKIAHDAIESSIMQIIADGYHMLRYLGQMKCEEIASAFAFINEELNSYLLKITAVILEQTDEDSKKPIIDFIIDSASAGQMAEKVLDEAEKKRVPQMLFSQSVFLRYLSGQRELRRVSEKRLYAPSVRYDLGSIKLLDTVKDAMKSSMVIAYAQGFELLTETVKSGEWNYGEDEIARVWAGASTIRSNYLARAHMAFNRNDGLLNLLNDDYFANQLKSYQKGFRETVMLSAKHAVPAPSFMSALSYYDSLRAGNLPANLIQSQLNFMGRDTVKRYDVQGDFNVDWIIDEKVKNKKDPL